MKKFLIIIPIGLFIFSICFLNSKISLYNKYKDYDKYNDEINKINEEISSINEDIESKKEEINNLKVSNQEKADLLEVWKKESQKLK